jgi:hypothetical protein
MKQAVVLTFVTALAAKLGDSTADEVEKAMAIRK